MAKLEFQVGNYQLHEEPNFNFQLNRVQKLGGDLEEVRKIAEEAKDTKSYVKLMKQAGDKAKQEGNLRKAAAYLRGQDFFTPVKDGKLAIYKEYKELYYKLNAPMLEENNVQKVLVPYENGFLPVLYCLHDNPKGTIVLHGGFDSYVEEFLKFMVYVYQHGYNAYIFEGPGQGSCINDYGMPFTPEWHKPVGAVLDHFNLDDVTLVGISLGAVLCKLAAAKEPRIKQVFSVGAMTNFAESLYARMEENEKTAIKKAMAEEDKQTANKLLSVLADKSLMYEWFIEHGAYVLGQETAYDFFKAAEQFDVAPIAGNITQDYLIVAGANDHFVPISHLYPEIDLLKNARSFTLRIITPAEKGDDHCNVSNRKLMLDFFLNWLEETKRLKAETEQAIKVGAHK